MTPIGTTLNMEKSGSYKMGSPNLQTVASTVLNRARKQGYVLPREVRTELKEAGQSTDLWKQVINLIRPLLKYRHGRYYAVPSGFSQLEREKEQLRRIHEAVRALIAEYQSPKSAQERRKEGRARFIRPVGIRMPNETELTVLLQDLSPSGARLIADRSLLGRKVLVFLPSPHEGQPPVVVVTRILWSCAVADGLYKSGGVFLELVSHEPAQLQEIG
jgi:hypothetical protein